MSLKVTAIAGAAGAALLAAPASANDYYVSVSGGGSFLSDSQNEGAFTSDFTTGEGTSVPAGAVLPSGTDVGWETEFDTGYAISGAIGKRFNMFRGELELSYQSNGVDTHSGVEAGGIALDGEDAGVLITGSPNLGVSVGDLVADGQGDVKTFFVMANLIFDLDTGGPIKPYIGGGLGVGFADVAYTPSATPIIEDDKSVFAYQAMAGLSYEVAPSTELFAGYRYRATSDVEVQSSLLPASLDIENASSIVEAGVRFTF